MRDKFLSKPRTQELINEIKRRDKILGEASPHWTGTKEELAAELAAGRIAEGTIIFVTNDEEIITTHEITGAEWTEIIKPIPETKPDSGGGGGHTIQNSEGTSLTQRKKMQFAGDLSAADDDTTSGDEKTVITPHSITSAEWSEVIMPLPGQRKEGVVIDVRGNEYVIGEYIQSDGLKKPLYERTYYFGVLSGSSFTLDTSFGDKHLISASGCWYGAGGVQVVPSNISVIAAAGNYLNIGFETTVSITELTVIVRYIKITDTPV